MMLNKTMNSSDLIILTSIFKFKKKYKYFFLATNINLQNFFGISGPLAVEVTCSVYILSRSLSLKDNLYANDVD